MTRKQRKKQLHRRMLLTGILAVLICIGIYKGICHLARTEPAVSDAIADITGKDLSAIDAFGFGDEDNDITDWTGAPPIDVELLTPNSWSRPQTRLNSPKNSASTRSRRAMCRVSMPRMLYSPSSCWRRFITKLLV